jgi:hypothetical protein
MPLGRSESLPLGLAMDLSYAATPLAGNQRHTLSCERREIARRRAEPGWRAAVLDERASRHVFSSAKRVRKAAAPKRQPQRAKRAMCTARAEALFPLRATTK